MPRSRSPAVSSSKGAKNFMAPTISASSKAVAASPRKKILAERNEVISVSDSLEFPLMEEVTSRSEVGSGAQRVLGALQVGSGAQMVLGAAKVSSVSSEGVEMGEIGSKSEMGSGCREILGSIVSGKVDSEIKNHKYVAVPSFSPSPIVAPLDADPSLAPYDPKTNYLSPRPQFLHYKPNPRFEHYLNKEGGFPDVGDGKQLEDSFSSESYEATSGSTEEAQSSPLQKESEEECSPTEVEVEEDTDGVLVSEPEFKSKPNDNHFKPWSFTKFKLPPLLLVLVIACLYAPMSDSPVMSPSSSMLKNHFFATQSLQVLKDYVALANVHLNGLANRFRYWSISSVAYLSTMGSFPKRKLSSFNLVNLTFSAVDQTVELDIIFSNTKLNQNHLEIETETEQAVEENMVEEETCLGHEAERKTEMEVLEGTEEDDTGYGPKKMGMDVKEDLKVDGMELEAEKIVMEVPEDGKEAVNPVEYEMENKIEEDGMKEVDQEKSPYKHEALKEVECEAEKIVMEVPEDVKEDVHRVEYNMENKSEQEDGTKEVEQKKGSSSYEPLNIEEIRGFSHHPMIGIEILGNQDESSNINALRQVRPAGFGDSHSDSGEEYQISDSLKSQEFPHIGSESRLSMRIVSGVSSAIIMLAATLVFLYIKQKQTTVAAHERLPSKKVVSVSGSSESYSHAKGSPYQNVPGGVDMVGDSGPSEISSSLHSSSSFGRQRMKRGKEEETLSDERRLRRDSAVSSSLSYGSFTTYEKLSAKKGCGDEDAVTPVRRSSRIRNHVLSP